MKDKLGSMLLACVIFTSLFLVGHYERKLSLAFIQKKELTEKNRKVSELYQKTNKKLEEVKQQMSFCREANKRIGTKALQIIEECKDIIENKKNCYRAEYLERK